MTSLCSLLASGLLASASNSSGASFFIFARIGGGVLNFSLCVSSSSLDNVIPSISIFLRLPGFITLFLGRRGAFFRVFWHNFFFFFGVVSESELALLIWVGVFCGLGILSLATRKIKGRVWWTWQLGVLHFGVFFLGLSCLV